MAMSGRDPIVPALCSKSINAKHTTPTSQIQNGKGFPPCMDVLCFAWRSVFLSPLSIRPPSSLCTIHPLFTSADPAAINSLCWQLSTLKLSPRSLCKPPFLQFYKCCLANVQFCQVGRPQLIWKTRAKLVHISPHWLELNQTKKKKNYCISWHVEIFLLAPSFNTFPFHLFLLSQRCEESLKKKKEEEGLSVIHLEEAGLKWKGERVTEACLIPRTFSNHCDCKSSFASTVLEHISSCSPREKHHHGRPDSWWVLPKDTPFPLNRCLSAVWWILFFTYAWRSTANNVLSYSQ